MGPALTLFRDTTWSQIDALRSRVMARTSSAVLEGAQGFVEDLATTFSSVVLARVFVVVPDDRLPEPDRLRLAAASRDAPTARTQALSLLGTFGRAPAWRDRTLSQGHLAIPLLSRAHVQNIPMLARLLGDLQVDFAGLDDGRPIASKRMLGGRNAKFFVPDAQTATDAQGRHVIPSRDFVAEHGVRTVFGMGGAYLDGTLIVTVIFTDELIEELIVDRFPSLISNLKMATAQLLFEGHLYA
jgi:hypothetical protein